MMAQRIGFEGNIGAGKTSLIRLVTAREPRRFRFYPEPLDEWEALGNVLEGFYAGEPGSGFLAQTLISQTLLRRDIPRTRCLREIGLYERSLMSARQCFIPAMLAQSQLRPVEADILVGMGAVGSGFETFSFFFLSFLFRILHPVFTYPCGRISIRRRLSMSSAIRRPRTTEFWNGVG